jgi:NDP-sugar pyrophosphorylase family protein
MKALILAGGKGTRLRPLTLYTPKPIVPLLNRPFLLYQIALLKQAGITDITLSLSYQPDKIEDVMGDGSDYGVELRFITEPSPMGTGGAYKFAAEAVRETTVVFNGDVLTDIDLSTVIEQHRKNGAEATICLAPVDDPSAYGLVETAGDGRVLRFLEKPTPEVLAELNINTINAGVYVLEPSVLDLIPKNENTSFEYNVFPALLAGNRPFFSHVLASRYWRDIGNPPSYLAANMDLLAGKIDFDMPYESANVDLATAAEVDRKSVLGEGCVIKPGAQVVNSVLGPGVHVEEKAVIRDSVIWGHSRISTAAAVIGSVLARSCYVGRNAVVGEGCVLGDKASLPDYSRV